MCPCPGEPQKKAGYQAAVFFIAGDSRLQAHPLIAFFEKLRVIGRQILKCLRLEGAQRQNARFGIIIVGFDFPGYQYGKLRLLDRVERLKIVLREVACFFGIEAQMPGGRIKTEPVQIIGRPVGRQIGAVPPDAADMLTASAVVVVLSVNDVLSREDYRP